MYFNAKDKKLPNPSSVVKGDSFPPTARIFPRVVPAFVPLNAGQGKLKGALPEDLTKERLLTWKPSPVGRKVATAKPLTNEESAGIVL